MTGRRDSRIVARAIGVGSTLKLLVKCNRVIVALDVFEYEYLDCLRIRRGYLPGPC